MSQFHFRGEKRLRAEQFLKQCLPTFSMQSLRSHLEKGILRLIPSGKSIELPLRKGTYLAPGDMVIWPDLPDLETVPLKDQSITFTVRYQDKYLLAVDKPAGIPTYPLSPLETGTLANGLAAQFPDLVGIGASPLEAGIVQRLDRGTSGLLLVAKNPTIYQKLRQLFKNRQVIKEYTAIVHGKIAKSGELELALAHNSKDRSRMIVLTKSKQSLRPLKAQTHFSPIEVFENHTLLKVRISTGVMHQIRAHLSHLGHPIVGEDVYTNQPQESSHPPRYLLHASRIEFRHPVTTKLLQIESPLPNGFGQFLKSHD